MIQLIRIILVVHYNTKNTSHEKRQSSETLVIPQRASSPSRLCFSIHKLVDNLTEEIGICFQSDVWPLQQKA